MFLFHINYYCLNMVDFVYVKNFQNFKSVSDFQKIGNIY